MSPEPVSYPTTPSRPGMLARFSLEQKVPLVAAALIVMVAAAVSIASYLEVRHIARKAAYAHINDVVKLVTSGQRTGDQIIATVHAIAKRPAIAEYVESPTPERRAAALAAMLTPVGAPTGNTISTDLMDESGHLLLTTNPVTARAPTDFPAGDSGEGFGVARPATDAGREHRHPGERTRAGKLGCVRGAVAPGDDLVRGRPANPPADRGGHNTAVRQPRRQLLDRSRKGRAGAPRRACGTPGIRWSTRACRRKGASWQASSRCLGRPGRSPWSFRCAR